MTLTKKQHCEFKIISKAVLSEPVKLNHFLNLCPLLLSRARCPNVEKDFYYLHTCLHICLQRNL